MVLRITHSSVIFDEPIDSNKKYLLAHYPHGVLAFPAVVIRSSALSSYGFGFALHRFYHKLPSHVDHSLSHSCVVSHGNEQLLRPLLVHRHQMAGRCGCDF